MANKFIGTERTTYPDGSFSQDDVYMDKDGKLFVNTYNVNSDRTKHDHSCMKEDGTYMGGHSESERKWVDRKEYKK